MHSQQIQTIPLELLVPHPENANVMPARMMKKIRKHIEATGRYEPLVVRPHPTTPGHYELINGHHRKEILASLHHTEAACVVWNLSDAETLLLLATINRLSGEDSPGKRLRLLEHLAADMKATAAELAALLPEEEATIEKLLARHEVQPIEDAPDPEEMPEALTFFMTGKEKRQVVTALKRTHENTALALQIWAAEKEANRPSATQ